MKLRKLITTVLIIAALNAVEAQEKNPGKNTFTSNLPIILLEVEGQPNAQDKIQGKMKVIDKKGDKAYTSDSKNYSYEGRIAIKLRGNSSLSFSQKKFTLETQDADGKELDVPLMDMPAEHDWVLLAPYADVSMLRDALAFKLWTEMGHWAPQLRMCEVVYNGKYAGIYALAETVKAGTNRLDIAKLKKTDTSGQELTGGYLLRIDTYDEKDATFTSNVPGIGQGGFTNQIVWTCRSPKKKNLREEQFEYIRKFIRDMEQCVMSEDFADSEKGYARYINTSSFIDYLIHTELSLNPDGYKRSAYFYKTKQNEDGTGGKLHAGPVWDYNLAYGNCNFCNADNIYAWAFEGCNTSPTPQIWKKLFLESKFQKKLKARYAELRKTTLSEKNLNAIIDQYASQLSKVQKRHFDLYPELLGSETKRKESGNGMMANMGNFGGTGMMPNGGAMSEFGAMPMFGGFPGMGNTPTNDNTNAMSGMMLSMFRSYSVKNYDDEIKMLKEWLSERLKILDEKLNEAS